MAASHHHHHHHHHHHTLQPPCRLAPIPAPPPVKGLEDIPPIRAHFFYSSHIPIDDPLAPATIVASSDARQAKLPLRPFSPADNAELERAWLSLSSDRARYNHDYARRPNSPSPALEREVAEKVAAIVGLLAAKHKEKHDREGPPPPPAADGLSSGPATASVPVCCPELEIDASAELRKEFCALTRRKLPALDQDRVLEAVMSQLVRLRMESETAARTATPSEMAGSVPPALTRAAAQLAASLGSRAATPPLDGPPLASSLPAGGPGLVRPPPLDDGISGKPFVRVEPSSRSNRSSGIATPDDKDKPPRSTLRGRPRGDSQASKRGRPVLQDKLEDAVEVPVGISRLHMVSLPVLQMKPLYWSPVNDIATVLRATWFYRDTMVPVEPGVANQLEAGYRELRPWTETWRDELKSALDVGALGEEKISHRLWPDDADKQFKTRDGLPPEPLLSSDPFCAARCFRGEAAAEGSLEPVRSELDTAMPPPEARTYAKAHVIYKDATTAFLLKPSQKPSAYYGRRPLSKIMKGIAVGLPVVRGFDWAVWERVNDKRAAARRRAAAAAAVLPTELRHAARQGACPGCELEKERGQVTDLVLVAHGIGQKLSERVESFHFTHAVNGLRRAVNIELESPAVKSILRPGQHGIMVLPVNWRHLVNFEDDLDGNRANDEGGKAAYAPDGFTLKDIEPPTIPAIRSMISDVMFDIPFYMSHLKPKMIAAFVSEANRVYRLWCRNNPGFAEKGRVHLIAHSLGSVMSIEVLSRQPTRVPRPLDLSTPAPDTRFFEFDVTNLFLLGSPAGFFLLLERGGLVPRRGRLKPGASAADAVAKEVVGDVGLFGCLAVDNIYNILAKEDPIAYLLNGTIDPLYADGLRTAYVPSIHTSFFQSVSNTFMRGLTGAPAAPAASPAAPPSGDGHDAYSYPTNMKPLARLPSQLELEVHDFTREEIAEKKAFLLNDNGQIDYFLRSGGGPLEIQYLNMLGAHTSYWTNQDLVRMLCLEVGRVPGRQHTLPSMRAMKKGNGRFGEV
ncbi:hypothetical protein VTJ83DRAFT_6700 [Remersonia thermophila]|uniref:DDHD domain-containing protein n=1 Tax=Remersonia thermophila TaxID=72144 RepID=A0ABR4D5H2_9PEZI